MPEVTASEMGYECRGRDNLMKVRNVALASKVVTC